MRILEKRVEVGRKLIAGEAVDKDLVDIENLERQIKVDPFDLMYSEKKEEVVSYRQKVMEIEADKDDFLFQLAGNKGETIKSLSKMTLSEIINFAERMNDGRHKS